jgi:hypothetical protein
MLQLSYATESLSMSASIGSTTVCGQKQKMRNAPRAGRMIVSSLLATTIWHGPSSWPRYPKNRNSGRGFFLRVFTDEIITHNALFHIPMVRPRTLICFASCVDRLNSVQCMDSQMLSQ